MEEQSNVGRPVGSKVGCSVVGGVVGAEVGGVVGADIGGLVGADVGELDGERVGETVGMGMVGAVVDIVGDSVIQTHVWPGVVQLLSEHRWVLAQLHRYLAVFSICSQMP